MSRVFGILSDNYPIIFNFLLTSCTLCAIMSVQIGWEISPFRNFNFLGVKMYKIMSWHLLATKKASQQNFFNSVKAWLTGTDGTKKMGLDVSTLPKEATHSFSTVIKSDLANLRVVCSEDENYEYSGFSLERIHEDKNFARVLECILKKSKKPRVPSTFEASISKYILDIDAKYNYIDNEETRLPRFINSLIEGGLAQKDWSCQTAGKLFPTAEDAKKLEECDITSLPIVYINKNDDSYEEGTSIINGYASILHPIAVDSPSDWKYCVLFKKFTDANGNPYKKDFSDASLLINCVFSLVSTSVSTKNPCTFQDILYAYEKNYKNKKITISNSMVAKIKEARKNKGLTQGELAEHIASTNGYDNPFNLLFISRIESLRQKRIESHHLSMLEKSLDLSPGYLHTTDEGEVQLQAPAVNVREQETDHMHFCLNCGASLPPNKTVRFCPYCGENLK